MRLDSHQHFWNYRPAEQVWIDNRMGVLKRDYLPDDLRPLLSFSKFDGTIAVQARQTLEETIWLLELADRHDFIKGVVGWVDLRSTGLRKQLKSLTKNPKLVGVRHVVHDEPDDNYMLNPDFRRGISQLREFGLAYDLLIFPKHLPMATKLAAEFSEQPFVLDHLAKPDIRGRNFSPWQENLAALGSFPNVFCKLSGLVTEAVWNQWQPEDFHHCLDIVLASFGPDRVMIGSDWPVCNLSGGYGATMRIVIDYIKKYPAGLREQILGGNCAWFYGIQPSSKRAQ